MLQGKEPITISEFNKGLFTKGNILINEKGHSPNCMDVKWNFDGSIQKRMGSTLRGTINVGTSPAYQGWVLDSGGTLSTDLKAYWKMDEVASIRRDELAGNDLQDNNSVDSTAGIHGNAALFVGANSENLYAPTAAIFNGSGTLSLNTWLYLNSTSKTEEKVILAKREPVSDGYTKLLLHGETSATATFFDSSPDNLTVTTAGNVIIDTAQKKFGPSSIKFDGTGDYCTVPDSASWVLGQTFTVDFQVRFNVVGDTQFCGQFIGSGNYWYVGYSSAHGWHLNVNNVVITSLAGTASTGTWYHIAVAFKNGEGYVFVNGIGGNKATGLTIGNYASVMYVGCCNPSTQLLNGWIDEIRVRKGVCEWTSNFTPPSSPYVGIPQNYEYYLYVDTNQNVNFAVSANGSSATASVAATSFGAVTTSTWYNISAFHVLSSRIGVGINQSVTTASYTTGITNGSADFTVGGLSNGLVGYIDGRIDETGVWAKELSAAEMLDLYGGGTGNTYTGPAGSSYGFGWGMFDFGATNLRWLVAAAGTGVYASSDMGLSFLTIGTGRIAYYQGFERSKNVLICTSDRYDPTLYWAGSAGTYCSTLAVNSAPTARFAINYKGFLILLNSTAGKRRFHYQDESTQLTSSWPNFFDLPSSADDEITAAFVINRILYVSTRYGIFKLSYVGGNPDWAYEQVQAWGFVPRTVKRAVIKGIPYEVVIGLDWSRHLRVYDGIGSTIVSENIEADNEVCDFAMSKISYYGSGIAISNAEFDPMEQEYRLNVAIGPTSTQTSHAIVFNARTLAMYPYANQFYQAMCMAESSNRQFLMSINRSSQVFMMNTGYTDNGNAISEIYDSPLFFSKVPGMVNKGGKLDLFFKPTVTGDIYFQDRADFAKSYSKKFKTINLNTGDYTHLYHSEDVPSTHNIYQYRLMSSGATTEPWILTHSDLYAQNLGIGWGNG